MNLHDKVESGPRKKCLDFDGDPNSEFLTRNPDPRIFGRFCG